MPDLTQLLGHWGYVALFVIVVLGNVGVPLPEETVLALAGYLVWRGDMRLPVVLVVGVVSAVAGDNLGYWVGRRFGRNALPRYALAEIATLPTVKSAKRGNAHNTYLLMEQESLEP